MEEQNNGSNPAFSSSSSFESLSTADLESCGGYSAPFTVFPFPKHPSSSSSFYRKHMAARSPRSPRRFFFSNDDEGAHHFLYSCHLCKKPLGCGRDIYMYRGDTPFCSEECRQEQIEMDEASEKTVKVAQKQHQKSENSSSPSKSEKIHVRVTGTVVAR